MSKPYDASLKALLEVSPSAWPRLAGFQPRAVKIIDADVSTVTAATDKVLRLGGKEPALMHFEFQSSPDAGLPGRIHCYNGLVKQRHRLPVHSVVVLLRREANLGTINGIYHECFPGRSQPYLVFHYQVLQVWQLQMAELLQGGIGTMALAPIAAVAEADLPEVIGQMKQRLEQPEFQDTAGEVWTAVRILMGLRYQKALIHQLLQGVHRMKESVTYQEILNEGRMEGRVEEARRLLLQLGERFFQQPPNPQTRAALDAIQIPDTLEQLALGLAEAKSWEELVPTPKPSRGRKKKA